MLNYIVVNVVIVVVAREDLNLVEERKREIQMRPKNNELHGKNDN
jgi:hypothetical protein